MAGIKKGDRKSTVAEMDGRITVVMKHILDGMTRHEILKRCSAWNLCDRQVDKYISEAKEKLREINIADREDTLALILRNHWELFRAARDGGDLKEARENLKQIAKVKGLDEATINHVIQSRPLMDISDDDLDEAFESHGGH